ADATIAKNTTPQELLGAGVPLRQALELELKQYGVVRFPRPAADKISADHPQPPAARIELPAEKALQGRVGEEGIAEAPDQAPALRRGPHERQIALLQQAFAESIARREHTVVPRPILQVRFRSRGLLGRRVPLIAYVEVSGVAQIHRQLRDVVRGVGIVRRLPWQANLLCSEIPGLAKSCSEALLSGIAVDDAGGEPEAELARVGDPVRAHELVLAEQLHDVEVGLHGIEDGQMLLGLERHVDVEQTWL